MKRRHIKINDIEFIDRAIKFDEKGDLWRLSAYQRRVLELALKQSGAGLRLAPDCNLIPSAINGTR